MRRSEHQLIERAREHGAQQGRRSQEVRRDTRLAAALEFGTARSIESFLVFELATRNPQSGILHYLEIRHEIGNGNDRFAVYLDGDRWRNGWSRSRFCVWLFKQIESVRTD